jgi:hypothetical protein
LDSIQFEGLKRLSKSEPNEETPPELGAQADRTSSLDSLGITNDLYLKVALASLVLLGINLAIAWILQFYFKHNITQDITYVGNDVPWLPKGTSFGPALGVHHFGDFEQYVGYATSSVSPYSSTIVYPALYGPMAVLVVKLLYLVFGWPGAVLVFLPASLIFFFWGICRILGNFLSSKVLAVTLLFTGGMLVSLDRGNLQILVAGLCVWFCVGLLEDRRWMMIASLAFAIAMKPYVVILALVLIKARRWKDLLTLAIGTVALYAIAFAIVGGSFFGSIRTFIHQNLFFASLPGSAFMLGCVSATAAFYKVLYLSWGAHHFAVFLFDTPGWYIQVPGVLAGLACLLVIWTGGVRRELALVAALAMMQLAPASIYPYVAINTVIELCLLMRVVGGVNTDRRGREILSPPSIVPRKFLLACIGLLVIGSAPWFGVIDGAQGTHTSIGELLSPVTSLAVVILLLIGSIRGLRTERVHQHSKRRGEAPELLIAVEDAPADELATGKGLTSAETGRPRM